MSDKEMGSSTDTDAEPVERDEKQLSALVDGLSDEDLAALKKRLAEPETVTASQEEPKEEETSWGDWVDRGFDALEKVSSRYERAGETTKRAAKGLFSDMGGAFRVIGEIVDEGGEERMKEMLREKIEKVEARRGAAPAVSSDGARVQAYNGAPPVIETEGKET